MDNDLLRPVDCSAVDGGSGCFRIRTPRCSDRAYLDCGRNEPEAFRTRQVGGAGARYFGPFLANGDCADAGDRRRFTMWDSELHPPKSVARGRRC